MEMIVDEETNGAGEQAIHRGVEDVETVAVFAKEAQYAAFQKVLGFFVSQG